MTVQHIFTGTTAPSSTPSALGQHYLDTVAKVSYISVGTSSSADWVATGVDGAIQSITGSTVNALVATKSKIVLTGSSDLTLQGIVSNATARQITFINATASNNIVVTPESLLASAANRIISFTPPGSPFERYPPRTGFTLTYNTVTSRWNMTGVCYPFATTVFNGLVSTEFQTFGGLKRFAPVGGSGGIAITTFQNAGIVYTDSQGTFVQDYTSLNFDPLTKQLGVQILPSDSLAVVHSKSTIGRTVGPSVATTFTLFLSPTPAVPSPNTSLTSPLMGRATGSAAINYASTGYIADNSTIDYLVFESDGTTYSPAPSASITAGPDDGSSNPYGIDLNIIIDAAVAGTTTATNFALFRQINGGGYTDILVLPVSMAAYTDDNTGWTVASSNPPTPSFPDFIASGLTRNYDAVGYMTAPGGSRLYSPTHVPYDYVDANDGNPYQVHHSLSTINEARSLGNADGVSLNKHFDSSDFVENADTWLTGADVTPNTYGYQSDGTALNRTYRIYNTDTTLSGIVYSSIYQEGFVTDPNDGLFYYVLLVGDSSNYKALRDIDGAGYLNSRSTIVNGANPDVYDDNVFVWGTDLGVLPTTTYPPAIYGQGIVIAKDTLRISEPIVPADASDLGNTGDFAWDDGYIYVCVATNTWKRVAIATW